MYIGQRGNKTVSDLHPQLGLDGILAARKTGDAPMAKKEHRLESGRHWNASLAISIPPVGAFEARRTKRDLIGTWKIGNSPNSCLGCSIGNDSQKGAYDTTLKPEKDSRMFYWFAEETGGQLLKL